MVTRDQNPELNLRTFSNVGPSWPDVHKVRLTKDMEIEDGEDDLQSMEEIKELEKDVKQALAQGANIEPNANVVHLCTLHLDYK